MAKEILLYGRIGDFSVESLINDLNDAKGDDISVRINSGGGDVQAGYGFLAKLSEFEGAKKLKIDGRAYSMAAFACCYAEDVEALDVSDFMFHRAAFPKWVENDKEIFTDEMKAMLKRTNDSLRAAFESKVDVEKFKVVSGVSVDELFSMDSRVNVFLTATEAKQIGLINKINKITPERSASIAASVDLIAASYGEDSTKDVFVPKKVEATKEIVKPIDKKSKMDLGKLKIEHPELFAEVKKIGATEEKNRAEAWLVFSDVDAEAVSKGIESGNEISSKVMAEMSKKVMMKATTTKVADDAHKDIDTPEAKVDVVLTADEKELADFEAKLEAECKSENVE